MANKRRVLEASGLVAVAMSFLAWAAPSPAAAIEASAVIGVQVDTTLAPIRTTIPTSTVAPTTTAAPVTTTTAPTTTTTTTNTTLELPEDPPAEEAAPLLPPVGEIAQAAVNNSVLGHAAAGIRVASKIVGRVASGTPVAQVLQEALPEEVAAVVVPAVRTASTFAFPISLGFAVFGFLLLQQRIDRTDPKLAAAPLAHEDDVVNFS
jgi:hypothetical protein